MQLFALAFKKTFEFAERRPKRSLSRLLSLLLCTILHFFLMILSLCFLPAALTVYLLGDDDSRRRFGNPYKMIWWKRRHYWHYYTEDCALGELEQLRP